LKEADIILTALPQADGIVKNRPALCLREMPRYGDMLVCGISTQLHQQVPGFDEVVSRNDADYPMSGLVFESIIRLGHLTLLPRNRIVGSIGAISAERHERLLDNLSRYLVQR
jgi:mRNA interferase MazF